MASTHEVTNQPPPLVDHDVYGGDLALVETVRRLGAETPTLHELGRLAGSAEAQRWGTEANAHPPVLRTHDRYGHRVDEVEYDPAYHELMKAAIGHGLHAAPWADDRPGGSGPDQRTGALTSPSPSANLAGGSRRGAAAGCRGTPVSLVPTKSPSVASTRGRRPLRCLRPKVRLAPPAAWCAGSRARRR